MKNNFTLSYYIDNLLIKTNSSNDDVIISEDYLDNEVIISIKTNKKILLEKAQMQIDYHIDDDYYFFNGYQSWTDSFEKHAKEKEKNVYHIPSIVRKMYALDKYGDATFYNYKKNIQHSYDIFYSKNENDPLFIYNKNYQYAYLIIELLKKDKSHLTLTSDIKGIELKENEEIKIFNFALYYDYYQGIDAFRNYFTSRCNKKLLGYTSWYNYYNKINEEIIIRDLESLDERFEVFQIDDGYQMYVGDWLDINKEKFPNGMQEIVTKIHNKKMLAGIWLAPFASEYNSKLFKEHPNYFIKDKNGEFLKAGGNWSGFYALDLSKQEVCDYIKKCLEYYMDLGFDFFKLDFLYCAHIIPFDGKSRAMTADFCYKFLRSILKDKYILGCGANIISSYNNFDYLRIGPDVSLKFDDVFYMRIMHRERISTKVTLQNTIFRSLFNHHLFQNDPDVFLLRDDNLSLKYENRRALITINALFGSLLFTSDNIKTYNEKEQKLLSDALYLFHNAKNKHYKRYKNEIAISYEIDGKKVNLIYDIKRGILK